MNNTNSGWSKRGYHSRAAGMSCHLRLRIRQARYLYLLAMRETDTPLSCMIADRAYDIDALRA